MLEDMKSMKGMVIKKLKSISTISSLKQGLVFRTLSQQYYQTPSSSKDSERDSQLDLVGCRINSSENGKGDQEQEQAPAQCENAEEDFRPHLNSVSEEDKFSAIHDNEETGRQLDCPGDNVDTISWPDQVQLSSGSRTTKYQVDSLVGAGESADLQPLNVKIGQSLSENCCKHTETKDSEIPCVLLQEFEEKCPPGGNEAIVLYTTSMRGIRKTFEDCNSIRFLLESFRVQYNERDVSMHLEYRDELWKVMGSRVVPPRLFIRGRYIGGADEVVGLHERGMLKKLLQGVPLTPSNCSCKGCAGVRFVLCFNCNGSRKIISRGGPGCDAPVVRCSQCNENGLVKCPICHFIK